MPRRFTGAQIAEARQVIEGWRREYNESRPHRALGAKAAASTPDSSQLSANKTGLQENQKLTLSDGTKTEPLTRWGKSHLDWTNFRRQVSANCDVHTRLSAAFPTWAKLLLLRPAYAFPSHTKTFPTRTRCAIRHSGRISSCCKIHLLFTSSM